jgi:hypothetical protein
MTLSSQKTRTSPKEWFQRHGTTTQIVTAIIAVLAIIGAIYREYTAHQTEDFNLRVDKRIDDKLAPLNGKLENLLERLSSVEGEIKGLLAQNSIRDSAKYAKEGKTGLSLKAAQQATSIFVSAAESKLPVSPGYFVDTIEMINGIARVSPSPALSKGLQDARLSLARYRSSLLVGKITYSGKLTWNKMEHGIIAHHDSSRDVGYFDASKVTGEFITVAEKERTLANNIRYQGIIITGGTQTLDGIHWLNVTFIGTHIIYRNGELDLNHVTFIGCTFEAPNTDRGIRFAEYASLLLPTLSIS